MGVAWRDLHEHFGRWSSVYRQFRRWTLSGLWGLLLEAFNDSGGGNASRFNEFKNARRRATRYDKTADSYLGFIHIVSIRLWMREIVNAS